MNKIISHQSESSPSATTALELLVRNLSAEARVPRNVARIFQRMAATENSLRDCNPTRDIGPFQSLPLETQNSLRTMLDQIERYRMRGLNPSRLRTALVQWLWEFGFGLSEKRRKIVRTLADFIWYAPRVALMRCERFFYLITCRILPNPRAAQLLIATQFPVGLITVGYVRAKSQDLRYTGYWHDEERNITVGSVLGLDLLPTEKGLCFVECNLGPASLSEVSRSFAQEPTAKTAFQITSAHNKKNLWVSGPVDFGINPVLAEALEKMGTQAKLNVRVFEDPRLPRSRYQTKIYNNYQQRFENPTLDTNDTLLVRYRHYDSLGQQLVQNKIESLYALQAYKSRVRSDTFLLPTDFKTTRNDRFPTHVYKITDLDKGFGVYFLKAQDDEHARSLMRTKLGGISESTLNHLGCFQPYVIPLLAEDRFVQTIRAVVLLSPIGATFSYAVGLIGGTPVPDKLPEGVIDNPQMFLSNAAQGGSVNLVPDMEDAIAQSSCAIAEAYRWALDYGFVTLASSADAQ